MKESKAQDLRDLSEAELDARYKDACKELFRLKNQRSQSKKLEKPHLIPEKKKEIARVLTVMREKELA